MTTLLEQVAQTLPRELQHLVWEYAEPVFPCDRCRAPVLWSTVVSWGQPATPDAGAANRRWWSVVFCSDACCIYFYTSILAPKGGVSLTVRGQCLPCHLRHTHKTSDNWFYAYPTAPCRGHSPCP